MHNPMPSIRHIVRPFFLTVLGLGCLLPNFANAQSSVKTKPGITAQDLTERLAILASDSLEGRLSGERGAEMAARYIASEFKRLGLQTLDTDGYLQHFAFAQRLDTSTVVHFKSTNVVGFLPGSDPTLKNEVVVVGAHYDHLGFGGPYALDPKVHAIHYGADDNASGTAGVLELAEFFSAHPRMLRRSTVFILFSGEEEGLFGSKHYTDNPLIPLNRTRAMINMDMIGRMQADSGLIVEGIGSTPVWRSFMTNLNTPKLFNLHLKEEGLGPSDHLNFYTNKIPVLFFFTGYHPDYHRSTDTKEKINYPGEVKVLELVSRVLVETSNSTDPLPFTQAKEDTTKKAKSWRVWVGGVPDYGYEGEGVRISFITEHSPAEKAGLKKDDVIVGFAGQKIKNIYDYTDALSKHKPEEVVQVEITRGKVNLIIPLTLGSRSESH
jgi:aminopeptidase YwaD